MSRFYLVILSSFCLGVAGCGGGAGDKLAVFPTEGKLTMDGEPFGPTSLQLIPIADGGHSVVGKVDASGNVKFTTYDIGDGAPAGDYKVMIGMEMSAPPKPFPAVYQNKDRSPLSVSVEEGENNLELAMDSKVGGPMYTGPNFGRGESNMSKAIEGDSFRAGAAPEDE